MLTMMVDDNAYYRKDDEFDKETRGRVSYKKTLSWLEV